APLAIGSCGTPVFEGTFGRNAPWQSDRELGATIRQVANTDTSAHGYNEPSRRRKAEPGASRRRFARDEGLENALEHVVGYAAALVADVQRQLVVGVRG